MNGDEEWLDHQPPYNTPSNFVNVLDGDDVNQHHGKLDDESALRDQIAMKMWNDYNN